MSTYLTRIKVVRNTTTELPAIILYTPKPDATALQIQHVLRCCRVSPDSAATIVALAFADREVA